MRTNADLNMNIPTGTKKEDFKTREEIITSFYAEWGRNNPEHRVFNDCLNDYILVNYSSLNETRRHAAKRFPSTMAVLQLDTILRTAKRVGRPLPNKPGSKNQKHFSKMIRLECQLDGIGKVKLLVGIKKKTGKLVQYCITVLE